MNKPACLVLADGTIFEGIAIGALGSAVGELVFNTSMQGYQEILTDPSYAHQMVMLTTSHVGNTGVNADDMESSRVWAQGLVLQNEPTWPSNYRSEHALNDFLKKHRVVGIAGVDTRHITHHLRTHGAQVACITSEVEDLDGALERAKAHPGLQGVNLADLVSRKLTERWHTGYGDWACQSKPGHYHVVVYDFGVKHSILKRLHDKGCFITVVPSDTSVQEVLSLNPDGIILSNGPGDPQACEQAILTTQQLMQTKIPIMGICLGFQMMALACGAKAVKMKFGHHGANHPVKALQAPHQVMITSQNHGFAIDEDSLPKFLTVTHRSLFDGSLQGIMHQDLPLFGFQGHPEAGPGPHDAVCLFDGWIERMRQAARTPELSNV